MVAYLVDQISFLFRKKPYDIYEKRNIQDFRISWLDAEGWNPSLEIWKYIHNTYMLGLYFIIRYIWYFLVIRYARENYRLIIDPKPMLEHN
jgi:hypothetical protein